MARIVAKFLQGYQAAWDRCMFPSLAPCPNSALIEAPVDTVYSVINNSLPASPTPRAWRGSGGACFVVLACPWSACPGSRNLCEAPGPVRKKKKKKSRLRRKSPHRQVQTHSGGTGGPWIWRPVSAWISLDTNTSRLCSCVGTAGSQCFCASRFCSCTSLSVILEEDRVSFFYFFSAWAAIAAPLTNATSCPPSHRSSLVIS